MYSLIRVVQIKYKTVRKDFAKLWSCNISCVQKLSDTAGDFSEYYDKFTVKLAGMQVLVAEPGQLFMQCHKYVYMYLYLSI